MFQDLLQLGEVAIIIAPFALCAYAKKKYRARKPKTEAELKAERVKQRKAAEWNRFWGVFATGFFCFCLLGLAYLLG